MKQIMITKTLTLGEKRVKGVSYETNYDNKDPYIGRKEGKRGQF